MNRLLSTSDAVLVSVCGAVAAVSLLLTMLLRED